MSIAAHNRLISIRNSYDGYGISIDRYSHSSHHCAILADRYNVLNIMQLFVVFVRSWEYFVVFCEYDKFIV